MAVLSLVHRALPFSFPWKRHQSSSTTCSKGKEKIYEVTNHGSEHNSQNDVQIGYDDAEIPDAPMHCDIPASLHIAVSQHLDLKATREDTTRDNESLAGNALDAQCTTHQLAEKCETSARPQLARVVSWASIVRSQCRWTSDQEKKLQDARKELTRCQKAWSSEQELWLAYVGSISLVSSFIKIIKPTFTINDFLQNIYNILIYVKVQSLSEEKEAHSDFLLLRTRQQDEEQHQFRKAWKRRRSFETTLQLSNISAKRNTSMGTKLRRLQRHGYVVTPLVAKNSAVIDCQG